MADSREDISDDEVIYKFMYTNGPVKKGSRFGPFPGEDAVEGQFKNWMLSVQKVYDEREANLILIEENGKKYFEAMKDIPAETCLCLWNNSEISLHFSNSIALETTSRVELEPQVQEQTLPDSCSSGPKSPDCQTVPDHEMRDLTDSTSNDILSNANDSVSSDDSLAELCIELGTVEPTPKVTLKCHFCDVCFDDSEIFIPHLATHNSTVPFQRY